MRASSSWRIRGSQNLRMCVAISTAAWSGGRASKLRTRSWPSRTTGGTPCPEGTGEPVIAAAPSPRWRGHHLVGHPLRGIRLACARAASVTTSTCTAVTLYSGQFVAQSEFSVVTTLAPVTGWWNVV